MSSVLVIGDDLTGANAAGAQYVACGLQAITVSSIASAKQAAPHTDVIVFNTESRHLSPPDAARHVNDAVSFLGADSKLIIKRIDTTLRGNLGSEVEALLVRFRSLRPNDQSRVLMVPAFPASNRSTISGVQISDGLPVAEGPAGRDQLNPVRYSRIADELAIQTSCEISEVHLDAVRAGDTALIERMKSGSASTDILIVDAVTDDDLWVIAEAAIAITRQTGLRWLVVDSGPFGAIYATELGITRRSFRPGPVLVVAGSTSRQSNTQLDRLLATPGVRILTVEMGDDSQSVVDKLVSFGSAPVLGVRTTAPADEPGSEAAVAMIGLLSGVTRLAIERLRPIGIYATGGDVSKAVLDVLGADGLQILGSVLPLAVIGLLFGGPNEGLCFCSKGGLIGDDEAAVHCVDAIRQLSRYRKMTEKVNNE